MISLKPPIDPFGFRLYFAEEIMIALDVGTAGGPDLDERKLSLILRILIEKRFNPEEGGSLSLNINKVSNDGAIELQAEEYCSSGDCKGDTIFAVREQLRLHETPGGLRLDILKMRRSPNEE